MGIAIREQNLFAYRAFLVFAVVGITAFLTPPNGASAYTFKTLYSFCAQANCTDGEDPEAGVIMDGSGNLFGTTAYGGLGDDNGTVYELVANGHGNWTYKLLYSFCPKTGCAEGIFPEAGLIRDTAGNLYGMLEFNGRKGSGSIYELSPNASQKKWKLKILYSFCSQTGCKSSDLSQGAAYRLTYAGAATGAFYDGVSPLYGTTQSGGSNVSGTAFQLTPNGGTGKWKFKVIHVFDLGVDGSIPSSLSVDATGNLYGTALNGGANGSGMAFELSPNAHKTQWNETILYSFCAVENCADGGYPAAGLLRDATGNLFGTGGFKGAGQHCQADLGCGVAFKLVPNGAAAQQTLLYTFCAAKDCTDGRYPGGDDMIMDASGNLFGSTYRGGGNDIDHYDQGGGTVFELNGSLNVLYRFCSMSNCADGEYPNGVIMDGSGNLFGTTLLGGANGGGTVFELTP